MIKMMKFIFFEFWPLFCHICPLCGVGTGGKGEYYTPCDLNYMLKLTEKDSPMFEIISSYTIGLSHRILKIFSDDTTDFNLTTIKCFEKNYKF